MESSSVHGRAKALARVVVPIFCVLGVMVPLGFNINELLNKPDLTYELHSSHYFPIQKTVISIIVRNEGRATAKQVQVKVKASAEIEDIIVQERDIAEKTPWFKLPGESVDTHIDPDDPSIGTIQIPFIVGGNKYLTDLIIKSQDGELLQDPIVESINGGRAERYVEMTGLSLTWFGWGFALGIFLTLACVFVPKGLRQYRHKGQQGPRKNLN